MMECSLILPTFSLSVRGLWKIYLCNSKRNRTKDRRNPNPVRGSEFRASVDLSFGLPYLGALE